MPDLFHHLLQRSQKRPETKMCECQSGKSLAKKKWRQENKLIKKLIKKQSQIMIRRRKEKEKAYEGCNSVDFLCIIFFYHMQYSKSV